MSNKQDLIPRGTTVAADFSFSDMQRMAASIAKAGFFGIKEADQAIALMLIAHAEGKHPATVARDFDIIQGRPAKKSEAILRDFQASGGKVEWHTRDDNLADATFTHPMAPKPLRITWDIKRAEKAGLLAKDMYKKFPRQMLSARCISEGCRATAPQATSGFYTPEEVRQFDDDAPPVAQPVESAVEQAAQAMSQEQIEAIVNSMDVTTVAELEAAFAHAWRSTKDPNLRAQFKDIYDSMRVELEQKG
jgi:hypothetical protein